MASRRGADEQRGKGFVIEEIADVRASWQEIEPLLIAMVESQRPHDSRVLRFDWASRWRDHLAGLPTALFLVARDATGSPIGFLNGSVTRDHGIFEEVYATVANAYVEPGMRRKRVASALLQRFEEWSRAESATSIRLDIVAGNHDGFVFWAASGFVPSRFVLHKPLEVAS